VKPTSYRLDACALKSAINLCAFVARFTALRRSGRQFVGLCPLHDERNPSFYVHPGKQVFHCFGCGAGGDVFAFVMRAEGCNFFQALEVVAEFLNGVARANKPRSGLWFGASEGAKPLRTPKAAAHHSQSHQQARARILEKLDATDRRLRGIEATNRAASAALATACEPERSDGPFYLKIKS
jgi:DNA primase